jgi:hypothetical protein
MTLLCKPNKIIRQAEIVVEMHDVWHEIIENTGKGFSEKGIRAISKSAVFTSVDTVK